MCPRSLVVFIAMSLLMVAPIPAGSHVEKGMPDSVAEMEYRILLEFKPGDLKTRIKLGMVLLNQNKLKEAGAEFRQVLKASPENQPAYTGLALLHLARNEPDRALEFIDKALSLDPENGETYLHYGKILQSLSRLQEARLMYERGLEKLDPSPDSEDHHQRLQMEEAIRNISMIISN